MGSTLRGKVARWAASGSVGRYKSPFCPQADSAKAQAPKAALFTIVWIFNMAEIVMTDLEYLDLAEQALQRIEAACDRINETTDADLDNQRIAGVVTLMFANGSQIVVNLQKPLQEIWLAARAGGFHYRYDGQQWADTKGGAELFEQLSRCASEQAGQTLTF